MILTVIKLIDVNLPVLNLIQPHLFPQAFLLEVIQLVLPHVQLLKNSFLKMLQHVLPPAPVKYLKWTQLEFSSVMTVVLLQQFQTITLWSNILSVLFVQCIQIDLLEFAQIHVAILIALQYQHIVKM
jgi:hypothetical protein